ncbi:MAG TPA: response regulator [Candidatus Binatia bacterium]|nr:response regulator [Candidatus Binatia bacterium]
MRDDMSEAPKMLMDCETILLAEDNADHVTLIKRAFLQARLLNPVQVVEDGAQAIAYLSGEGKYADRKEYPMPALVLLDLKMPNKDGFEVLEWIRRQPELQGLRVVVLTTSDRIYDVQRAYELGAHSFLTKPLDVRDFVLLGPAIKGYWVWTTNPQVKHPELLGQFAPG